MKSWRTSALGFLSGLAILIDQLIAVLDADASTSLTWEQVTIGLGLIGIGYFSRDNKVTSEKAGAK